MRIRILERFDNNGKKRLFLLFGICNFLITNVTLQILLLFNPIFVSTILSQIVNISLGFYFYGKKVFKFKKFTMTAINRYLLLALFLWISNTFFIKFLNNYGFNKNLAAILVVPFLASSSYYFQKKFIFVDR